MYHREVKMYHMRGGDVLISIDRYVAYHNII